jgi:hypothetical protein
MFLDVEDQRFRLDLCGQGDQAVSQAIPWLMRHAHYAGECIRIPIQ